MAICLSPGRSQCWYPCISTLSARLGAWGGEGAALPSSAQKPQTGGSLGLGAARDSTAMPWSDSPHLLRARPPHGGGGGSPWWPGMRCLQRAASVGGGTGADGSTARSVARHLDGGFREEVSEEEKAWSGWQEHMSRGGWPWLGPGQTEPLAHCRARGGHGAAFHPGRSGHQVPCV